MSTEDLYSSLGTFSLPNSGTNLLRDRIKDIAEEKVKESLVSDLADISSTGPNPNDVLSWNDTNAVWEPTSQTSASDKITEGDSRVEVYDTGNSAAKVEFFIDNNLQLKLLNTKLLPSAGALFDLGDTTTPYYSLFLKSEDTNNNLATGGLHIDGQRISVDQNNNDLKYNANSVPHYSGTVTSGQYLEYDTNAWTLKDTSSLGKANLTYAACSNEEWDATHYYYDMLNISNPSFSADDSLVLDHVVSGGNPIPSDARETLIFTFYNQNKNDVTITDIAFGCNSMTVDYIKFGVWSSKESDFFVNGQVTLLSDELALLKRTQNAVYNISGCFNDEVSYTVGGEHWFGIIMFEVEKATANKKFYCSFNVEQ